MARSMLIDTTVRFLVGYPVQASIFSSQHGHTLYSEWGLGCRPRRVLR